MKAKPKKSRGRPKLDVTRSRVVGARFSDDEYAIVVRAAAADDRDVSAWIRLAALRQARESTHRDCA